MIGSLALVRYGIPAISQTTTSGAAGDGKPIWIRMILPLTGGSPDMGNSAPVGAQVAINQIHQVGGYLGRPLRIVICGDKADPDTALVTAEDIVPREEVVATIGLCNTGVAVKALDVLQKSKNPVCHLCTRNEHHRQISGITKLYLSRVGA